MAGKLFIGFPIRQEFFFPGLPEDTDDVRFFALLFEMTFNAKTGRAFLYILLIGLGKIAFCKTEIIDRVQQVGFADPVLATDADDPFDEVKAGLAIVLELNNRYIF